MAENIKKKGGVDVNQNTKTLTDLQLRCREKIRKRMKAHAKDDSKSQRKESGKKVPKPKSQKKEVGKKIPLQKGKSYKSSEDRSVKEKDPKEVKIKYEATKPGGRSSRGEFYQLEVTSPLLSFLLYSLVGTEELSPGI